jgi:hypothetical protein
MILAVEMSLMKSAMAAPERTDLIPISWGSKAKVWLAAKSVAKVLPRMDVEDVRVHNDAVLPSPVLIVLIMVE